MKVGNGLGLVLFCLRVWQFSLSKLCTSTVLYRNNPFGIGGSLIIGLRQLGSKISILVSQTLQSICEACVLSLFWIFFFTMRDLISGSLFSHNKRMKDSFIKSRIIRGGSAKIEQCMRTAGWDPLNPSAAVAVYIAEKTGTVNAAKIVLAGSIEKFAIDATTLFPSAPEDSTIEFSNINLGAYRFMTSHMATRWISDSDFTWTCYVKGLNQESQPEMVAVSPVNFEKHNLSHISLRILAQPISATKIKLTFGVAPVPHKTILKQDDSSDVGFPIIEVHNTAVDIFPPEGKDDQHGIGFQPFILDMRKEEPDQPLPSSSVVKSYSCDLLARATMPTSKKSRKTWEDSIAKGDWSARDSSKVWPSPMESDVETENESSNISGGYNYYIYHEKPRYHTFWHKLFSRQLI